MSNQLLGTKPFDSLQNNNRKSCVKCTTRTLLIVLWCDWCEARHKMTKISVQFQMRSWICGHSLENIFNSLYGAT